MQYIKDQNTGIHIDTPHGRQQTDQKIEARVNLNMKRSVNVVYGKDTDKLPT